MKKSRFRKWICVFLTSVVVSGFGLCFASCGGDDDELKGAGTTNEPYQISTVEDFLKISMWDNATEKKYFVLMNNLDFEGEDAKTLSAFYGELDGQNYSVYNFSSSAGTGLIHENFGTIKNLKIAGTKLDSYSIYTSVNPASIKEAYVGGLADINSGAIINCGAQNVKVSLSSAKVMDKGELLVVFAGGLVGRSSGIMRYCYAKKCSVSAKGDIAMSGGSDGKCAIRAGGMLGGTTESATVEYCYGYGNEAETFARGGKTWSLTKADLWSYAGGLVGDNSSTKMKYLFAYECNANASYEEAGKSNANVYYSAGEVIGASYVNCEYIYSLESEKQNVVGSSASALGRTVKKIGALNTLLEDSDMKPNLTEWIIDDTNQIAFKKFLYAPLLNVETTNAE